MKAMRSDCELIATDMLDAYGDERGRDRERVCDWTIIWRDRSMPCVRE
jgi:hypothetical protein